MDAAAEQIFAAQYNVASRRQLIDVLGARGADALLRSERVVAAYRGIYHPAGMTLCDRGRAMAAILRCPDGAALTGPLGLGVLHVVGFTDADPFEMLLPPGSRVRKVDFRCRPFPTASPPRMLGPLRLACPARLLVDAGRPAFGISDDRLWAAYDSARWSNATSTARFLYELSQSGPRDAGAVRWRNIADDRILQAESPKERALDLTLRRFHPAPEPQVWVTPRRRVDYFWRVLRLAIEYLGDKDHAYAAARARDVTRDDEISGAGVQSLFVVKEDLGDLGALAAWLVQVVNQRAAELGVSAPRLRD